MCMYVTDYYLMAVSHHDRVHAIKLTLFLWHMPDDATEGVAELQL